MYYYSTVSSTNMNARLDIPLYTYHNEVMAKQNRKRIRHRSNKSRRLQANTTYHETPHDYTALPKHMLAPTTKQLPQLSREESATTLDKRMFGGEDDDTASAMELRGPMLQVVLGLFNGIDYDDAAIC